MHFSTHTEEEEKEYTSIFLLKCVLNIGFGMPIEFDLGPSWNSILKTELSSPGIVSLKTFLNDELSLHREIYPPAKLVFSAFHQTSYEDTSVVIVGQDPYHGFGQAHGLCFSVQEGVRPPPSLKNIFKEISSDIGPFSYSQGCLDRWAEQGVLLLNSLLTVRAGEPASHKNKGWELFTDAVLAKLNKRDKPVVFMLWGKYAQEKGKILDSSRHLILECAHPSPFSATKFFGCRHFSKANKYLLKVGSCPIDWICEN